jgi:hypothetical protein
MKSEVYTKLIKSPLAFVYVATRLPTKKLQFKVLTQTTFMREVRTSIVIS